MRKQKQKVNKFPKIFYVLLAIILCFSVKDIVPTIQDVYVARGTTELLQKEKQALVDKNTTLKAVIDGSSDDYYETLIRDKLGYSYEGEIVYRSAY